MSLRAPLQEGSRKIGPLQKIFFGDRSSARALGGSGSRRPPTTGMLWAQAGEGTAPASRTDHCRYGVAQPAMVGVVHGDGTSSSTRSSRVSRRPGPWERPSFVTCVWFVLRSGTVPTATEGAGWFALRSDRLPITHEGARSEPRNTVGDLGCSPRAAISRRGVPGVRRQHCTSCQRVQCPSERSCSALLDLFVDVRPAGF